VINDEIKSDIEDVGNNLNGKILAEDI